MSRPETQGFKKRVEPKDFKVVNLARVSYSTNGKSVFCSCGWSFGHIREKVREDAVDRHFRKRHQGRGIRL